MLFYNPGTAITSLADGSGADNNLSWIRNINLTRRRQKDIDGWIYEYFYAAANFYEVIVETTNPIHTEFRMARIPEL